MTRQIWCIPCAVRHQKKAGTHRCPDDPVPRRERVVFGVPKRPKLLCDNCGEEVNAGDRCMAWTTWRDEGDNRKPPTWESHFLYVERSAHRSALGANGSADAQGPAY